MIFQRVISTNYVKKNHYIMSFWWSLKQRVGFKRAPLDRLNDDYSMFHSMTIRFRPCATL